MDLYYHRSADMISNCEANTTRTYPSFWIFNNDGSIATVNDVTLDLPRKCFAPDSTPHFPLLISPHLGGSPVLREGSLNDVGP
ncbi:MAG: hypothetical protein ACRDZ7_02395, partial [Acidimicrobiia bacterium]